MNRNIEGVHNIMKKESILFKIYSKIFKRGYTLAEVLLSIAVIGVIAAVVTGAAIPVFQEKTRNSQVNVSKRKFQKAQELMALNGEIGPYYSSTYDFVKAFGKYMSINRICKVGAEPSELPPVSACFGDKYEKITLSDGTTANISDIQNGSSFNLDEDENNDWTSPNIALQTLDGTRILLSYNKKCAALIPGVYSGDTTSRCVAGIMDVDGDKLPNAIEKDIVFIGKATAIGDNGEAARIAAEEEAARIAAEEEAARIAAEEAAAAAAAQQAHDDAVALGNSYCSRMSTALISSCTCNVSDTNETRCTTRFSAEAGGSVYSNCRIYTNNKGAAVMDNTDCR